VVPGERGGADADTFVEPVVAQIRAPRPGGDGDADVDAFRVQAHFVVAQENQRADVTLLQLVDLDHLNNSLRDLLRRKGDVDSQDFGGVEQPLDVLRQAENGGLAVVGAVTADALEHPVAVVQGVGEDVDVGLVPRDQCAVHPDLFRFFHVGP